VGGARDSFIQAYDLYVSAVMRLGTLQMTTKVFCFCHCFVSEGYPFHLALSEPEKCRDPGNSVCPVYVERQTAE